MSYIKGQEVLLGNNWYRVENEDPLIIRKIKLKSILQQLGPAVLFQ